ncbi:hypothetical protein STHU_04440 [Allostella humosa]|nr:hypothetical protein STHU_04440 [Stella humosa]
MTSPVVEYLNVFAATGGAATASAKAAASAILIFIGEFPSRDPVPPDKGEQN